MLRLGQREEAKGCIAAGQKNRKDLWGCFQKRTVYSSKSLPKKARGVYVTGTMQELREKLFPTPSQTINQGQRELKKHLRKMLKYDTLRKRQTLSSKTKNHRLQECSQVENTF